MLVCDGRSAGTTFSKRLVTLCQGPLHFKCLVAEATLLSEVHVSFAALGTVGVGALDLEFGVVGTVPRLRLGHVVGGPVELEGLLGVGHHSAVQILVDSARNFMALELNEPVPHRLIFLESYPGQLGNLDND